MLDLQIDNILCKCQVDTRVSVTVIPEKMWREKLASLPLQKFDVKLKSHSGHSIPVVGKPRFMFSTKPKNLTCL